MYQAIEKLRKEKNGCLLTSGDVVTKVRLLTCKDDLMETQEYLPTETCGTTAVTATSAAPVDCKPKFNPCVKTKPNEKGKPVVDPTGTATRRKDLPTEKDLPFVPDVCETYLYRKVRPNTAVHANSNLVDACPPDKADASCSPYCRKEFFAADVQLECVDLDWSEAFWAVSAEALGDAVGAFGKGLGVAAKPFYQGVLAYIGIGLFVFLVLYVGIKWILARASAPTVVSAAAPAAVITPPPSSQYFPFFPQRNLQ
jgi:hypothetical protein